MEKKEALRLALAIEAHKGANLRVVSFRYETGAQYVIIAGKRDLYGNTPTSETFEIRGETDWSNRMKEYEISREWEALKKSGATEVPDSEE